MVEQDGYTIERHSERCATITDPDGKVWENMAFGPGCEDTEEAMLHWHRNPKTYPPKVDPILMAISSLSTRVAAIEAHLGIEAPDDSAKEQVCALERAIQEQRARAEAAEAELAEKSYEEPEAPEPPEMVADLLREGHSMGDAANELARRWAEFANLRQLNQELTPEQLAQEKRLQKALNWFQGDHSIEVV